MMHDPVTIHRPSQEAFARIVELIGRFELDDRSLSASEFLVAYQGNQLLGFGRIRKYATCSELCSLGVVEPRRHQGIGSQLVQALVADAPLPLYLVCIIPGFFQPFGFRLVAEYPAEMSDKLLYCREALTVPEEYVVMKYEHRAA